MVHLAIAETLKRLPHFRTLADDVVEGVGGVEAVARGVLEGLGAGGEGC